MKIILYNLFLLACGVHCFGQSLLIQKNIPPNIKKPSLTSNVFGEWPIVKNPAISNDGKYVFFIIQNQPVKSKTLVIKSLERGLIKEIVEGSSAEFSNDSKKAFYIRSKDSLFSLNLESFVEDFIYRVKDFKLFMQGESQWMISQLNSSTNELILLNLKKGTEKKIGEILSYTLASDGNSVLLLRKEVKDSTIQQLSWLTLSDFKLSTIWEGLSISNIVLDNKSLQLAFMLERKAKDEVIKSIWIYKKGTEAPIMVLSDNSVSLNGKLSIEQLESFSKDDKSLYVLVKEKFISSQSPQGVKVDIWSYLDQKLQSQQLDEATYKASYQGVIHLGDSGRFIRLQQENDVPMGGNESIKLFVNRKGHNYELFWNKEAQGTCFIVSIKDGSRRQIPFFENFDWNMPISKSGEFVFGYKFKREKGNYYDRVYYSSQISTGVSHNLTNYLDRFTKGPYSNASLEACLNDDKVLLNDGYDIWQIDPSGKMNPINITNGYGRKNDIQFNLAFNYDNESIAGSTTIILKAFNQANKNSGFYRITLGQTKKPELLTMGPFEYATPFFKAANELTFLVSRSSAAESPNIFSTNDFKNFFPVSKVYPEKMYNWLTSELHDFKTKDGNMVKGILYKPESFDARRKYPTIITYYIKKSNELNMYKKPMNPTGGELDISWFVSHEYLVFVPDINLKIGEPGMCAYNSVVGSAKYLSKFDYIDTNHIGIHGHSLGGYETNFIVTHCNIFAAAVSSCGVADLISTYGSLWNSSVSRQDYVEIRGYNMGYAPWEKPNLYLKNTPIFHIDKVTTPILLINNRGDQNVDFSQGLEFFTGLRRSGKRSWMLQYDGERHGIHNEKSYKDYITRLTQFYDHYLKDQRAPKWMTKGIPAVMKGIDSGLDIDYDINTPGPGLVNKDLLLNGDRRE